MKLPECSAAKMLDSAFAAIRADEARLAFSVLEHYGVPQGRAETVANGINVLMDRMHKQIATNERQIAACVDSMEYAIKFLDENENSSVIQTLTLALAELEGKGRI